WRLAHRLEGSVRRDVLDEALGRGRAEVFNAGQGVQFTAQARTGRLEAAGVAVSMDGRGGCLDNGFVERLWRTVKYEDLYLRGYEAVPEVERGWGGASRTTTRGGRTRGWRTARRRPCARRGEAGAAGGG